MKQKTILLELLRWLCAGLAVVFLVVSFRQEPVSSAAFEDVASAVTASIDLSALQEGSVQMVKRLYGLNPSDFDGCLLYYPQTNMEAEELLLLKLRDTSQQEAVRAAVEARLETQKTSFDGYGLEQYDLLTNHSILDIRGNYVLFIRTPLPCSRRSAARCKEGKLWHSVHSSSRSYSCPSASSCTLCCRNG